MSRRQARELALQALFQLDFNQCQEAEKEKQQEARLAVIDAAAAEMEGHLGSHDRQFVEELVNGTMDSLPEIDGLISSASKDWKLSRMAGVDRNITRMAVFELKFREEKVTPNIIINEAVELAKKFGTDDSSRFVNGILGAVLRK